MRELCAAALAASESPPTLKPDDLNAVAQRMVRKFRLGEEPELDVEDRSLSPGDRIALMGELALTAYAMRGDDVAHGIRRDVVRSVRGGR